MASYQDNKLGNIIYADDIRLLSRKHQKSPSGSAINANLKLIDKDYTQLIARIDQIDADYIVTPAEKQIVAREWNQINALRANTLSKADEYNLLENVLYLEFDQAYNALSDLIGFILDPLTLDEPTDISGHPDLSDTFATYFEKSKLLGDELFLLETGMFDGWDYRVKLSVNIKATVDPLPLDGSPSTLSAVIRIDGVDVTADYASTCFHWMRETADQEADTIWTDQADDGSTITVDVNDLVNGHATFMCIFNYDYSESVYISEIAFKSLSAEVPGPQGEDASYIVEQDAHIFIFDSDFISNKLLSPAQTTDAYIVELEHDRHDKVVTLSEGGTWFPIKDKTWSEL